MTSRLFLLITTLLTAAGIHAQEFSSSYLTFSVTDATAKTVEVTGHSLDTPAVAEIPASVSYEGTDYTVTSIGKKAFANYVQLSQISIPNSVETIGDRAFFGCMGLTSIDVAEGNPAYCTVDGTLFTSDKTQLLQYPIGKEDTSYSVPEGVTVVSDYAFSQCMNLAQITLPESVVTIEDYAFSACTALEQIALPANVTTIGNVAFGACAFEQISLPGSVTTIGDQAFSRCLYLQEISIPKSVTFIGNGVFESDASLTAIEVDSENPNYCSVDGVLFSKDMTLLREYPCGRQATAYTIPDEVTTVNDKAFSRNSALSQLTISKNVTTIGDEAFAGCFMLEEITVWATTPPSLKENSFFSVNNEIPVYVPEGTLGDYQASDWSYFTNLQENPSSSVSELTFPEDIRCADGMLLNPQGRFIRVYDLTGRLVYSGRDTARTFPTGIYVVRCEDTAIKMAL